METALKPCPGCLSKVEIIEVFHKNIYQPQHFFFVHCNQCGQGTAKAYPSKSILSAVWNAIALEGKALSKSS